MNCEDFYGAYFEKMKYTEKALLDMVSRYSAAKREKEGIKPIVYCCSRIKTPESMLKKLAARGYEQTLDAAVNDVYDGVGIRVVCAFAEDVYRFVNWIKKQPSVQITEEKDYCEYPKPNGYRSYHTFLIMLELLMGKHTAVPIPQTSLPPIGIFLFLGCIFAMLDGFEHHILMVTDQHLGVGHLHNSS